MWRPDNVVPEHKRRAKVIWGILLLAIVGYIIYLIVDLRYKLHNPSTNFSVSDDVYTFPIVNICFSDGMGCGGNIPECIATAYRHVARDACSNPLNATWTTDEVSQCLVLDFSDVEWATASDCNTMGNKPYTTVEVIWLASDAPDEEIGYSESVDIMLGDDESTHEYAEIPYTRVEWTSDTVSEDIPFTYSALTIGKNTRNYVGGDSTVSYPVLSSSSNVYVRQDPLIARLADDAGPPTLLASHWPEEVAASSLIVKQLPWRVSPRDGFGFRAEDEIPDTTNGSSYALGVLYFSLTQGSHSLTELSDVDPFDIGSLLGNIGGFWELLLVAWGLCFVAARAEAPTEQGRNFTKPIEKGKDLVSRSRRRSNTPSMTPDLGESGEERPYWSAAGRGREEVPDGSIIVTPPPVGAGPSMDLDASSRRPIAQDRPMRLVDHSSRSIISGDSFMMTCDERSTKQQNRLPV